MYAVTKEMRTETAHRLNGHPGRCQYLHGHSYRWQVTLQAGEPAENGMLVDFSQLKARMVDVIDPFDHALVLENIPGREETVEQAVLEALQVFGIAERVLWVPYRPTAENMAKAVCTQLKAFFPQFQVTVRVHETSTSWAEYAE